MTTQIDSLTLWKVSLDATVLNLTLALKAQHDADFSDDPRSTFQKADRIEKACYSALRALAIIALKKIDSDIGASSLISDLGDLAGQAKAEADRIAQITHTIDEISDAVDMVTNVVTKIAGLPFI